MIKCPICKEEIQEGAIKCKHCGEILNKVAYAENNANSAQTQPSKIQIPIPIGRLVEIFWRKAVVIIVLLGVLCIAFNVSRPKLVGACLDSTTGQCHSFVLGPVTFHLHTYADYTGWCEDMNQQPFVLCHSPVFGFSLTSSASVNEYNRVGGEGVPMIVLPIAGIIIIIGFTIFWWRFANRHPRTSEIAGRVTMFFVPILACITLEILLIEGDFSEGLIAIVGLATLGALLYGAVYTMRQIKEIKNGTTNTGEEKYAARVLTLQFDFKNLGLGKKIILGSAAAAFCSLFLPWISMGIISSSGWNQQGYLFSLLFVYPVIGVFNVKGLNKIAGIICGSLALVVTIWYIADKHYEIMGVAGNASGSGLYLFAASTIGLIVGAVKYKRQNER